jgi:uncharacterized repeat protein (TIGR01451 family)/CSLREA domain-containing protein
MSQNLALKRSSYLSIRARVGIMLVLLIMALIAMPVLVAHADDFTVDDTGDGSDSNIGNGICATSGGVCTLRAAIQEANAQPDHDTISFSLTVPSTITLTSALQSIYRDVTIAGPGADSLSVSGAGSYRVFDILSGTTVTITDVTIRDGNGDNGGGIRNQGTLMVSNSIIFTNTASGTSTNGNGGGIHNSSPGTLILSNCIVRENVANVHAGGIYNVDGSVNIANSTIADNIADNDGNNSGDGGGINHSTDSANVKMTIVNSTISGNSARDGGGIRNNGYGTGSSATVAITNTTLSGNTANRNGGGIVNVFSNGSAVVNIVNSTVATNTAGSNGGGIYVETGTAVGIRNTIVADNADTALGNYPDIFGTPTSQGYNLIGNVGNQNFSSNTTGDYYGDPNGTTTPNPGATESSTTIDPLLGLLADNGGDTWTHALQLNSPALNYIPEGGNNYNGAPGTDQRGVSRPRGAACDIGAYEAQAELTLTKTVDNNAVDPGLRVVFTVTVDNSDVLTATKVFISDTLPAGLTFATGSIALDPAGAGTPGMAPPILAQDVTITPSQRVTVTFAVTVNTSLAGGTEITNTAVVTSDAAMPQTDTVKITVNKVAPVASDASFATDEDIPLSDTLLASDDNGDDLTYSVLIDPVTSTVTIIDTSTGAFVYTPTGDFNGTEYFTFVVTDTDGLTDTAQVTITVNPVNDAPTLDTIGPVTISEDAGLQTVDLSGVGSGAANESQTLGVTAISTNTALIPDPTVDYSSPNVTGTLTFTPVADQHGVATVVVTVTDGISNTSRTFQIAVNPINDPPTLDIIGDVTIDEDAGLQTVDLSGVGSGAANESQTLGVTAISTNTALIPDPTVDYSSPNVTGTLAFTPVAEQYGVATVVVTVTDGISNTSRTFQVIVNSVNDPPVATGDEYTTDEDTRLIIGAPGLLGNDTDLDTPTLSVIATSDTLQMLFVNADGSFEFDPRELRNYLTDGEEDRLLFTYTVSDGALTDTATITITVTGINDRPTANDDGGAAFTTDEDTPFQTGDVLDNDGDPEGEALSVDVVGTSGTLGLVSYNGDGTFDYNPNGQFESLAGGEQAFDTFIYIVSDGTLTNTATVTITITGVNDPPVAVDDPDHIAFFEKPLLVSVDQGVLTNDFDAEDDSLMATLDSGPVSGSDLALNPDGSFVYTPTAGFSGVDTFTYRANDGLADSNVASVTITVLGPTDADLRMSKVVDNPTPIPGEAIVYMLQVTNYGPVNTTGVVVSDTLPGGVSYVGYAGDGVYGETSGVWTVGSLDRDASATLYITVTVDWGTLGITITNTAVISASDRDDPVSGNNRAEATITVTAPNADLAMTKNVDDPMPGEGDTVIYTLQVTNNGPAEATGVVVSDTLPSGVSHFADDGDGDYDEATGIWTVGSVDDGATATMVITLTVDADTAGTTITNTAVISDSAPDDLNPGNNRANATIIIAEHDIYLPLIVRNS